VSSCRELVVEGTKPKGRRRKTWREYMENDRILLKLNKSDRQNRIIWNNSICGKCLISASDEKGGKTDDDLMSMNIYR
jgi:hypothetical protein